MTDLLLTSDDVNRAIDGLILSGRAATGTEAERMFLDDSLEQIAALALHLSDDDFEEHEAVRLVFSHGSRPLEDRML